MQAGWWLVWPKLFGPGARAIVEGWTPSGHTRLLSASRLTVAPGHCMHSQQSGQQSATLLRIRALAVPVDRLCLRLSSASCCAEEWGFAGTLVLIGLYMFMLLRIITIAERQRSAFNRVYAYTVAMILFYHFAINIGMNIGFAPVIGIPLPFFSYGGSSMMSFSIMMFILLKLDSQRRDVLQ
jgi:hypothetical protein